MTTTQFAVKGKLNMHIPVNNRSRLRLFAGTLLVASLAAGAFAEDSAGELRVCADPDNFPFSDEHLAGFENKLAEVVAKELKASLRYTWYPQRRGFIRETLKAGKCDLVIGVPNGYDLVLTTKPYYRSTYVFVYPKKSNLDLHTFDDSVLRKINIGVHAFGDDGANSPPVHALARRGIASNVTGFSLFAAVDNPPGKIIDALARGRIDVAVVWGPYAGFFALRQPVAMEVRPVLPGSNPTSQPFSYDISMGVRPGDTAFLGTVQEILDRRHDDIRKVLEDFGVPLVGAPPTSGSNGPGASVAPPH
ncbi:MAG: mxaJ protein [Bryobacterales bacterium]|jgi:quinoprotein dehydrogenase-associated probable ABC transporter substrate-binding protein|nr:mxaJ protein [Bryobacterales bacterium]